MSEILQIFHHAPPSHHQMQTYFQRGLLNVDSQFDRSIDSDYPSPAIFDVADQFQWPEFAGSPLMDFSGSSVDELSVVTTVEQNQRLKRKLEFDVVKVDSQKQSAEFDLEVAEASKAKRNNQTGNSKSKIDLKPDYVHVRARRGEATDSHSLAERARRERIKKKMQLLQDLVPGCNKLTNKASILDEIISYVQCLQRDVQFLTLKLATSTTSVDLKMENSLPEEEQPIELSEWQ